MSGIGWTVKRARLDGVEKRTLFGSFGRSKPARLADARRCTDRTRNRRARCVADADRSVGEALTQSTFDSVVGAWRWAIPATMAGSLFRCGEAGSSTPFDMCTTQVVSSTVTNCGPDFCTYDFRAAQAGENQGLLARDEMAAVEFGRDLDRQAALWQGFGRVVRVGGGGQKIAAERDEDLDLSRDAWPRMARTVSKPCLAGGVK